MKEIFDNNLVEIKKLNREDFFRWTNESCFKEYMV